MRLSRGRVLETPAGPGSPGPPSGPPTQRVLPEALVRAHAEAETIVAEARQRAEAIVSEARQKAASARAEAEREGREEGTAALTAAWLRLRSAETRELAGREEQVLMLGRLLAERLLGRALSLEPTLMVDLTREALAAVVRARRVSLYVNPEDAETLRRHLGGLGLDTAAIDVHADPSRPRGGLRAETDLGTLDAELAPQLDRLVAALRRS